MKFLVLTVALMLGASACNKSEDKRSDAGTGVPAERSDSNMESEMSPEELDAPAGTDSDMGSGSAMEPSTDMNTESGTGADMGTGSEVEPSTDMNTESETGVGTGTAPDSFPEEGPEPTSGHGQGEDIQSDENIDSGERDESL